MTLSLTLPTADATRPDMAALLCALTDAHLMTQEPRHPRDMRPFEQLMLNLLPRADSFTRSVIAQKLAKRTDTPRSLIDFYLQDEVLVAEPLIIHSPALTPRDIAALLARKDPLVNAFLQRRRVPTFDGHLAQTVTTQARLTLPVQAEPAPPAVANPVRAAQAVAEQKFHAPPATKANPNEKMATEPSPAPAKPASPPPFLAQMVRAAVLRRAADLSDILRRELKLPAVVAAALLRDQSGEALIAACHYLHVPEDPTLQIISLLYPGLTRSPQSLAQLRHVYRAFAPGDTQRLIAAWRIIPLQAQQAKTLDITPSASPANAVSVDTHRPAGEVANRARQGGVQPGA